MEPCPDERRVGAGGSGAGSGRRRRRDEPLLTEQRTAGRAVVLDPDNRVLLVHWVNEAHGVDVWLTPGGGVEEGESAADALARELREEAGLVSFGPGPLVWTRRHSFRWGTRTIHQRETFVLVRVPAFEPQPEPLALEEEGVREVRRWTIAEIERSEEAFEPRRLAALLRELLDGGPQAQPVDAGH